MRRVHLCSGLLTRAGTVLLVRCAYSGQPQPLWVLPGGRQEPGETIAQTVVREFAEEAGLSVSTGDLAYVSESLDDTHALHVVNCTFRVHEADVQAPLAPRDPAVIEARFVPFPEAGDLLRADVLRVPVMAALAGDPRRYFAFRAEDIRVPFFVES